FWPILKGVSPRNDLSTGNRSDRQGNAATLQGGDGSPVAASGCPGIANLRTLPFILMFRPLVPWTHPVRAERPEPSSSIVRKSLQLHLCYFDHYFIGHDGCAGSC